MQSRIDWRKVRDAVSGVKSAKTQGALHLLPSLIWTNEADVAIEIGIEYGYTTALIASTLSQLFRRPRMLSVDKSTRGFQHGTRILAGFPNVESLVLREMSATVDYKAHLKEIGAKAAKLIYIDGDHSRDAVLADIDATLPVLARDGLYVFHDYIERNGFGVGEAIYEAFADASKWNVFIVRVPVGMPFALVQRHCEPVK